MIYLFKQQITIHLDNNYYPGNTFRIKTINNSVDNMYIQSAEFNGKAHSKNWFYHSDFIKGGELILNLGPEPNKEWGTETERFIKLKKLKKP